MIKSGKSYHVEGKNTFYEMSSTRAVGADIRRVGCFVAFALIVVFACLALSVPWSEWLHLLGTIQ